MLGIIGGMGPLAGIEFTRKIVSNIRVDDESQILNFVLISNNDIPSRQEAILIGKQSPEAAISKSIESAVSAGAKVIVIACFTAHHYYEKLVSKFNIPILNLPYLVINKAKHKKILLLGTSGALNAGVAKKIIDYYSLDKEIIYLDKYHQAFVDKIIRKCKINSNDEKDYLKIKKDNAKLL
jgi:aspartate racemase